MALQTGYQTNLLDRSGPEKKKEVFMQEPTMGLEHSSPVLFPNGATANTISKPRKRGREAETAVPMVSPILMQNNPIDLMPLLHPQHPSLLSIPPLGFSQSQTNPGIELAYSPILSIFKQQKQEIDQLLRAQGEQLRGKLAETQRRQSAAVLAAAEEMLQKKQAELTRVARRNLELEEGIARLRSEVVAWKGKAMMEQAAANILRMQLQAAALPLGSVGESPAEDAESAHVDLDPMQTPPWCRACRSRLASYVLLPCNHLCLCGDCSEKKTLGCPVCFCFTTGSIEALLS